MHGCSHMYSKIVFARCSVIKAECTLERNCPFCRKICSRNSSSHWKQEFQSRAESLPLVTLELIEETKRLANDCYKAGSHSLAGGHYRFALLMLEQLGKLCRFCLPQYIEQIEDFEGLVVMMCG